MRIIAIDPGYERLGIAILEKGAPNQNTRRMEKDRVLFSECFKTSPKATFEERILLIGKHIEDLLSEYSPEGLAIENLFMSNNQKTAMRVAEVRGTILYLCKKAGLFIKEFTPLQIKLSVTGNGKSGKNEVIKMVNLLVINPKTDGIDDEYDAIAAGLACFATTKTVFK